MAKISRLPVSSPFPSLEKSLTLLVPKGTVTRVAKQRHFLDTYATKAPAFVKQTILPVNRAQKIIKNVSSWKIN